MTNHSRQQALVAAMPAVFVLIWSTGFIVARYGMPYAPPMKFLALRYVLSVACFAVWALAARAAWPADRRQYRHLAVVGVLMHAGYLGGVWAAVKLGMGAGLAALLVGLQPVLTALWISSRGGMVTARRWSGKRSASARSTCRTLRSRWERCSASRSARCTRSVSSRPAMCAPRT